MHKAMALGLMIGAVATGCAGPGGYNGYGGYDPVYGGGDAGGYGGRRTVYGAAAGAAVGGAVGGIVGGRQGALIGALSGAVIGGLAGRYLSSDPFSQYSYRAADNYQDALGARAEATRTAPVTLANGQQATRIDEMRIDIPGYRMEAGGRLSPEGYQTISRAVADARASGGSVQLLYPANASQGVLHDLQATGASLRPGSAGQDYVLLLQRGHA